MELGDLIHKPELGGMETTAAILRSSTVALSGTVRARVDSLLYLIVTFMRGCISGSIGWLVG